MRQSFSHAALNFTGTPHINWCQFYAQRWAADWMAPNWPVPVGFEGSRMIAARIKLGEICLRSSNHFALMLNSNNINPSQRRRPAKDAQGSTRGRLDDGFEREHGPERRQGAVLWPQSEGVLILDASGRYASLQGRPDRAKLKTASRFDFDATPAELKAVVLSFAANFFGTWSVNEAGKSLTRRFESALIPNNDGTEQKSTVSLSGDELRLTTTSPVTRVRTDAVYRRAK
jgi:hypothetical protein